VSLHHPTRTNAGTAEHERGRAGRQFAARAA